MLNGAFTAAALCVSDGHKTTAAFICAFTACNGRRRANNAAAGWQARSVNARGVGAGEGGARGAGQANN